MIFDADDADGWHRRNHAVLTPERVRTDPLSATLRDLGLLSGGRKVVCELGAATGRRLAGLQAEYPGHDYRGLELSPLAVAAGQRLYPGITLECGSAEAAPWPTGSADLLLLSFVLHWIARERLDLVRLEVTRLLKPGGVLALADFWPEVPTRTVYHHRPALWTWKQEYSQLWLGPGGYDLLHAAAFPHNGAATAERCGIWILRQGGTRG